MHTVLSVHLNTHTCAQPTLKFSLRYTNLANVGWEKKERGGRKRVGTGNMEVKGGAERGKRRKQRKNWLAAIRKLLGRRHTVLGSRELWGCVYFNKVLGTAPQHSQDLLLMPHLHHNPIFRQKEGPALHFIQVFQPPLGHSSWRMCKYQFTCQSPTKPCSTETEFYSLHFWHSLALAQRKWSTWVREANGLMEKWLDNWMEREGHE